MLVKKKNESKQSFTAQEFAKFKAMYDAVKSMEEDDSEEEDDMEEEDDSEETPTVIIMAEKKKSKMIKKSD